MRAEGGGGVGKILVIYFGGGGSEINNPWSRWGHIFVLDIWGQNSVFIKIFSFLGRGHYAASGGTKPPDPHYSYIAVSILSDLEKILLFVHHILQWLLEPFCEPPQS